MKRILTLFLFFAIGCFAFGQLKSSYTPSELDSLWSVWQDDSVADTTRLHAIGPYSWYKFVFSEPDSALYYADLQHELAKKIDAIKFVAFAMSTKGTAHWVKGEYDRSLYYFQKNLEVSKVVGKKSVIASAYNKLGIVYGDLGNYVKQIECYQKSLRIREELGDLEPISITLGNIGGLYQKEGNMEKALEYQQRSLEIREKIGAQHKIALTLASIGTIYEDLGEYDTALDYHERSLKIGEEYSPKKDLAWYLQNMGNVYKAKGDHVRSLQFYQRSMPLLNEMQAQPELSDLQVDIGGLHFTQKKYLASISDCKKAYDIALSIKDIRRQRKACECLYKGYKSLNSGNQALRYHEKMLVLADSLKSHETAKKLQQMEFAKIISQDSIIRAKEALITQEKLANQESKILLLDAKNRVKSLWIVFGSLAALLILSWIYYRYRQRVKYKDLQNELLNSELEYKKKDLTNFAVNISNNQDWAISLSERLDSLKTSTGRKRAKELEDLDNEIKNKIWVDKSSDEFYTKVDALSSSFFDRLTTQFEGLSKTEVRLCSLIKLNLDTKQIAALQNISPSSVKMSRYRLRKKLNLSPEDDLNAFLRSF